MINVVTYSLTVYYTNGEYQTFRGLSRKALDWYTRWYSGKDDTDGIIHQKEEKKTEKNWLTKIQG